MKKLYRNTLLPLLAALAMLLLACTACADEAAHVSISGEPYYGVDYVQFALQGDGDFFYDVTADGVDVAKHVYCNSTACTVGWDVGENDPTAYTITAYRGRTATAESTLATATVSGVYARLGEGGDVLMGLYPARGENTDFAAPSAYYHNGVDYDRSAETPSVENGDLYFTYAPCETAALSGSVTYVDETGAVLGTDAITGITPENPVTVTLDAQKTFGGQTYNRSTGLSSVTARYDGQVDFTVLYTHQCMQGETSCTVCFTYKDAASGETLTTDSLHLTQSCAYHYTAPQTFALSHDGVSTVYTAQAGQTLTYDLTLDQTSGATENYDILYTAGETDAQTVNWAVVRMNGVTGAQIDSQLIEVAAGGTGSYHADDLTLEGTVYEPVGQRDYSYAYGDGDPLLYIYYVPAGYTPEQEYTVTLQYLNIADNSLLYSRSITVAPGEDTLIESTANYSANGSEYVRLAGQQDSYRHSYYSPKRTYSIYYRNVNDTLYEDTVVTVVHTVTTEVTEEKVEYIDGGTRYIDNGVIDNGTRVVSADGGSGAQAVVSAGPTAGSQLTGVENDATGQSELRTEEGGDIAAERETIAEDETPLAGGDAVSGADGDSADGLRSGSAMNWALLGAGALILLLLLLIIRQAFKNRRKDS